MKVSKFDYISKRDKIIEVIQELMDDNKVKGGSFSNGGFKKKLSDYKNDINLIKKELKEKYNIDLYEFINNYEKDVFSDHLFIQKNALYDALLYSYDKNKGILYGIKLSESDAIEHLFKYQYSYYNYDMGKRYLLQSYGTMKKYFYELANNFLEGLIAPDYDDGDVAYLLSTTKDYVNKSKIKDKCSLIEYNDEGSIIFISIKTLLSFFNGVSELEFIKNIDLDLNMRDIEYDIKNNDNDNVLIVYFGKPPKNYDLQKIKDELKFKFDVNNYNI